MKEVKMYKVMFNEYHNELVYRHNKISTAHHNSDGEYVDEDGMMTRECHMLDQARSDFSDLWDKTIKPADLPRFGWAANPWVWVIEFERIDKPKGWCES